MGILQELPDTIVVDKAILIAGFKDDLDFDPVTKMFQYQFDWGKIKKHAKKFIFIHSDDDPYVNLNHGRFLEKN